MRIFRRHDDDTREADDSMARAEAAIARADHAMDTARNAQSAAGKIAASILERVERNHLAESIEATFGRSAGAGGKA